MKDKSEWPVTDPVLCDEEREIISSYQTAVSKKVSSLLASVSGDTELHSLDDLI